MSRGTLVIGVLATLSLAALVQDMLGHRQRLLQAAQRSAQREAAEGAREIDSRLRTLMARAEALAQELGSRTLSEPVLYSRLRAMLAAAPESFEVGVAYVPYARAPEVRLYAPHAVRADGKVTEFQLEQRYDYTEHDWFKVPIELGRPHWGEPYFGQATQALVVGYAVPFGRHGDPTGRPLGVVRINLSLEGIRQLVSSQGFGQTGYAFLLSAKGVFLASPVQEDVQQQRTFADFAKERVAPEYQQFLEQALRGEHVQRQIRSALSGQESWFLSEPIPASGWVLGAVFFQDEISPDPISERRALIRLAAAVLLVLLLLIAAIAHRHVPPPESLWYAVAAASFLLVLGIAFVWGVSLYFPSREGEEGVRILEPGSLRKYLATTLMTQDWKGTWVEIPTGVLIQGVWNADANSLVVTGYLWQRYPTRSQNRLTQGFVLPEAGSLTARELFRRQQGETEVVGWSFEARLPRPSESTHRYPFDSALVRIRMRHPDFDKGVFLSPNLEAYPYLAPTALAGIDWSLKIPGWKVERSHFSYSQGGQAPSFGLSSASRQPRIQDLCFSVSMQRRFLDPFIAAILPIVVGSCLLFMLVMVGTKDKERGAATGFKATDIIRGCISLLFPVVFAQISIRTKVAASGFIYVEYFYFVMYLAILLITINALVFTTKNRGLAQFHDNLVPKLLFWPLLLGAFFAVTLVFLY